MKFTNKQGQTLKLVLYTTPTCGDCHHVLNEAQQLGLDLPYADASEEGAYRELMRVGGKPQVPCLMINGKAMYESRDIMRFLEHEVVATVDMDKLIRFAKARRLEGGLSYQLSMHGDTEALDEFYKVFSIDLEMVYPATKIEGIAIEPNEAAIHIVSFKNQPPTHHNREPIIEFIHKTLQTDLWHGSWWTAIGRS